MRCLRQGLLAVSCILVSFSAFASAEFMAAHPAWSVNSEYVREIEKGYVAIGLKDLQVVTPAVTEHLETLKSEFNPGAKKALSTSIEVFARRFEWSLRLSRLGYQTAASTELDEAIDKLLELNIDFYKRNKDIRLAGQQTEALAVSVAEWLSQRVSSVSVGELRRVDNFKRDIETSLDTPEAKQILRQSFIDHRLHNGVLFGGMLLTAGGIMASIDPLTHEGNLIDAFPLPMIVKVPVVIAALAAVIGTNFYFAFKVARKTQSYNRKFSKVIQPQTLSAVARSCNALLR